MVVTSRYLMIHVDQSADTGGAPCGQSASKPRQVTWISSKGNQNFGMFGNRNL